MTKSRRGEKKTVVQFPLWPDENGILQLPHERDARRIDLSTRSPSERNALRSRRLPRSRPGRRKARSAQPSFFWSSSWLRLRSRIILSLHLGSKTYFAQWLDIQLDDSAFGALEVGELLTLASKNLGIDQETARRYLIYHTRATGAFKSDGDIVTRK